MSAYIFVAVGGGSVGLLAGGVLTAGAQLALDLLHQPPDRRRSRSSSASMLVHENKGLGVREGVDVLGSVLVTAGLMLGVYAVVKSSDYGWGSARTLVVRAIARRAARRVLRARGARSRKPIMPLRILRVRGLLSSSVVRGFLFIGMYGCFFLGTLYLEHVLGYGALQTGFAFLPMTLIVRGASRSGITARPRRALRPLADDMPGDGARRSPAFCCSRRRASHAATSRPCSSRFAADGRRHGTASVPLLTIAHGRCAPADAGLASGIVNVSMQVAGAIGVAVLGTIATDHTRTLIARGIRSPAR